MEKPTYSSRDTETARAQRRRTKVGCASLRPGWGAKGETRDFFQTGLLGASMSVWPFQIEPKMVPLFRGVWPEHRTPDCLKQASRFLGSRFQSNFSGGFLVFIIRINLELTL